MAADSDSMRSVLGCPLLASWIAYKFYLSQDFNSIPALDTRPLRIPSLLLRKTVTLLPFPSPPPSFPPLWTRLFIFYFFSFFFPRPFLLLRFPLFPAIGGLRLVSIGTTRRVTLHHFRLPSFFLSFSFSLFLRSIRLDGGALLYYFVPRLKAIRWCYAIRVINLFEMENVTPRYYRKRCIVFHV